MVGDEKRTFDACCQLLKHWASRHDQRRGFEWKMTLGLWTIIAVGIGSHEKLQAVGWSFWAICSALAWVGFTWGWLFQIWKANNSDKVRASHFAKQATAILARRQTEAHTFDQKDVDNSFRAFIDDWSMRYQSLITLLLLVIFVTLLFKARCGL